MFKNRELRQIVMALLVIGLLAFLFAGVSGKLDEWFGIKWFSGTRAVDRIIYVGESEGVRELFAVDINGENIDQITRGADVTRGPVVSPDGYRIAFCATYGMDEQVYTIDTTGAKRTQISRATGAKSTPVFNPDGLTIAYISGGYLYVSSLDGSSISRVLPTDEEIQQSMTARDGAGEPPLYEHMAWVAPATIFTAGSYQDQSFFALYSDIPNAYLENMELADEEYDITSFQSGSDNEKVIVVNRFADYDYLFVYDPLTRVQQKLESLTNANLGHPAISPDGSMLAIFVSSDRGPEAEGNLVINDAATNSVSIIADGHFESPSFSPDATRLAVVRGKGPMDLMTFDIKTGEMKTVVSADYISTPVWGPLSASAK